MKQCFQDQPVVGQDDAIFYDFMQDAYVLNKFHDLFSGKGRNVIFVHYQPQQQQPQQQYEEKEQGREKENLSQVSTTTNNSFIFLLVKRMYFRDSLMILFFKFLICKRCGPPPCVCIKGRIHIIQYRRNTCVTIESWRYYTVHCQGMWNEEFEFNINFVFILVVDDSNSCYNTIEICSFSTNTIHIQSAVTLYELMTV